LKIGREGRDRNSNRNRIRNRGSIHNSNSRMRGSLIYKGIEIEVIMNRGIQVTNEIRLTIINNNLI